MATACKFTVIWRFSLVWDSVDLIHKFWPVLWEKMVGMIRGSREDLVYVVYDQYRHRMSLNWCNA